MTGQETASEWLARKKQELGGRMQGNHLIPGTGSIPRKEASEETCISASKGVPGLEERIALMRKRSKVNQVVDDQERDDQNTEAAAMEMEVAEVVAPPVAPLAAPVAAPEKAKEVQKSNTTSWIDTTAAAGVVTFAAANDGVFNQRND